MSGHASRCRLPPVSKRPQSVRVCRTGVSRRPSARVESVKLRGNSTGHTSRCRLPPVSRSVRVCRTGVSRRQAKGELHRARAQVSPSQRSESVKLRGNSRVSRGVSPRRCAESVQLRGNSTGHPPRCRLRCRLRPCRIRQAKRELHRARVQVSPPPVSNPSS